MSNKIKLMRDSETGRVYKLPITDINDLIELSLTADESLSVEVDFSVFVDDKEYIVYDCSVANRDIMLYTEQGCLTYLVDSYGDEHTIELFNIEE